MKKITAFLLSLTLLGIVSVASADPGDGGIDPWSVNPPIALTDPGDGVIDPK